MARQDIGYDGYFPEYASRELEKEFMFSNPFGESPLGFVERRDEPVAWGALEDLAELKIGTVLGYVNTDEFDSLAAAGVLSVETVTSDLLNVRKVAAGRLRLAVIDRHVLAWLLENDDSVSPYAGQLQFSGRALEIKPLFVCFRRGERGEELAAVFNEGLGRIDADAIMAAYLEPESPARPGGLKAE